MTLPAAGPAGVTPGAAVGLLRAHGYTSDEQLTTVQLLELHGVRPKAIRGLGAELAARGLAFADS